MEDKESFLEDWLNKCGRMTRPMTMLETFGRSQQVSSRTYPLRGRGPPAIKCFHCDQPQRQTNDNSRVQPRILLARARELAKEEPLWTRTVITNDWICPKCQETPLVKHESWIKGVKVTGEEITCSFCGCEGDLNCVRLKKSSSIDIMICEDCYDQEVPIYDSELIEGLRNFGLELIQENDTIKKNQNMSSMEKARPYINSGLRDDFAMAIVNGTDSNQIMDLWDAEWWKQYPEDDKLLRAVLDGSFTVAEGEWLNNIRSDHSRLVMSCIERLCDIAYAKQLIESGFDKFPDAINDILDGGTPSLIARIRKLDFSCDLPGLDYKIELE